MGKYNTCQKPLEIDFTDSIYSIFLIPLFLHNNNVLVWFLFF